MSTTILPTRHLVAVLRDAALTTLDPKMELPHLSAVLLHTDRGPWQIPVDDAKDDDGAQLFDEVQSDLLVGTSTMISMVAQVHASCTGQLHRPVLISAMDADAVVDVFTPLVSKRLPRTVTHRTVITYDGEILTIAEDPEQVPDGVKLTLTAMDLDTVPRNLTELLDVDFSKPVVVDGNEVPALLGTGWEAAHLGVLSKVAGRRKMPVGVYRSHQRQRIVVEIGAAYRAVVSPFPLKTDNAQDREPQVELYHPDLPARRQPDQDLLVPATA